MLYKNLHVQIENKDRSHHLCLGLHQIQFKAASSMEQLGKQLVTGDGEEEREESSINVS